MESVRLAHYETALVRGLRVCGRKRGVHACGRKRSAAWLGLPTCVAEPATAALRSRRMLSHSAEIVDICVYQP